MPEPELNRQSSQAMICPEGHRITIGESGLVSGDPAHIRDLLERWGLIVLCCGSVSNFVYLHHAPFPFPWRWPGTNCNCMNHLFEQLHDHFLFPYHQ